MKKIALSLLIMAAPAYAGDTVRTTLNGVPVNADVVTVTNPSGGGSGTTAVTAAPNSYSTGFSPDVGKIADAAYTDTTGAASGGLVALNKAQFVKSEQIRALLAAPLTVQTGVVPGTALNGAQQLFLNGCRANSTVPVVVTTGTAVTPWCGLNGQGATMISDSGGLLAAIADGSNDALSSGTRGLVVHNFNRVYNAGSWAFQRGDSTGTWTISKGGSNLATGQVSVGTTATLIAAARTARQKITYDVTTAVQCSFGNSGVTLTTGFPLTATAGASQTVDTSAAIYGVCASTATIGFMEQY